jgi:hypothetical protein
MRSVEPGSWAQLFPQNWDHPQEYTMKHRPGIAQVIGDTIVLNGTTVEEVRDVHVKTLKLAVAATNVQAAELSEREHAQRDAAGKRQAEHSGNVGRVASEVKFD